VTVASVRPARNQWDHADLLLGQVEGLRDLLAHAERAVCPDVHRCAVATDVGDRGARSDRRVSDRREHVRLREAQRRAAKLLVDSRVRPHGHLGRRSFDWHDVPLRNDRRRSRTRLLIAVGHDADDVAIAHDGDDARHRSRRGVVERAKLRPTRRRAHHRAVRHARQAHVGDEFGSAGDDLARFEVWHRPAGVPPAFLGHDGHPVRNRPRERLRIEQLDIRHALPTAYDGARFGIELFLGQAELRARAANELMARERRGLPQERRLLGDRVAAERAEVEGDLIGISKHHVDPLDRNIELVGHDLCERGANALAEFDLSRKRGDGPVALDADPLLEPLGLAAVPHQDGDAAFRTARIARP